MNTFDEPEAEGLSEEQKKEIRKVIKRLQAILPMLRQPMDPNVYPLIDVSINMLETQIDMEIHHTYEDDVHEDCEATDEDVKKAAKQVKKELEPKVKQSPPSKNSSSPSKEELEGWFNLEGPDE